MISRIFFNNIPQHDVLARQRERDQEYEADHIGMLVAVEAGFDPSVAVGACIIFGIMELMDSHERVDQDEDKRLLSYPKVSMIRIPRSAN